MTDGDVVSRYVMRCRRYQLIVLVIRGRPGAGKSALATELAGRTIATLEVDNILHVIANGKYPVEGQIYEFIRENYAQDKIDRLTDSIVAEGLSYDFATLLVEHMPRESRVVVVEGYSMLPTEIYEPFVQALKREGCRIWEVNAM